MGVCLYLVDGYYVRSTAVCIRYGPVCMEEANAYVNEKREKGRRWPVLYARDQEVQ